MTPGTAALNHLSTSAKEIFPAWKKLRLLLLEVIENQFKILVDFKITLKVSLPDGSLAVRGDRHVLVCEIAGLCKQFPCSGAHRINLPAPGCTWMMGNMICIKGGHVLEHLPGKWKTGMERRIEHLSYSQILSLIIRDHLNAPWISIQRQQVCALGLGSRNGTAGGRQHTALSCSVLPTPRHSCLSSGQVSPPLLAPQN